MSNTTQGVLVRIGICLLAMGVVDMPLWGAVIFYFALELNAGLITFATYMVQWTLAIQDRIEMDESAVEGLSDHPHLAPVPDLPDSTA